MSIETQRSFLTQYIQHRGWQVTEIYSDDGFSGSNFDRPAFQRMLHDIEAGRINTVITKDLSRLGRDQIGTAHYYQIYFPQRQVRYIAVAEGFDTSESGGTSALFPFLTAANDFYIADISRKVRTALSTRKKDGKFIGSSPPLGYQKDPEEKGHLIAEEQGAEIVQQIFQRYLSGGSVIGVAKTLTEQGIPTPSQCKAGGLAQSRFPGVWSDTMVRRILTNPTYAGNLTQNRREKLNYKLHRRINLPRDAWIIVPNTHEPLVSQEEFDRVQEMLAVRSYSPAHEKAGHLLTGLAYCAECGSPMTYVKESQTRTYMVCQGYRKGGRLHLCTSHCIREDAVLEALRGELKRLSQQLDEEGLREAASVQTDTRSPERQLKTARQKLEQQRAVLNQLCQDRASGILTEDEFCTLLSQNREERKKWKGICEQTEAAENQAELQRDFVAQLRQFLSFDIIDRVTVAALIDRVLIHEDKTIELIFRFCKPD